MTGGGDFDPRVTDQSAFSLSGRTQGLKSIGDPPPQSGCQTDRQELPSCPILTLPPGETQVERFPQKPIQSTATSALAPHHPSIRPLLPTTTKESSSLFPGGQSAYLRHSQCTHAHLRQFCKVPVYLLSGRCPQNIMHHTHKIIHSFSLCLFFFFFFVFLCVSPSQSKRFLPHP